jgi:hypothetical protein
VPDLFDQLVFEKPSLRYLAARPVRARFSDTRVLLPGTFVVMDMPPAGLHELLAGWHHRDTAVGLLAHLSRPGRHRAP